MIDNPTQDSIDGLVAREDELRRLADVAAEKQHARGKGSARERIGALLDEGSFVELDAFATHRSTNFGMDRKVVPGDGVVTGYGTLDGRQVCIYSRDFRVRRVATVARRSPRRWTWRCAPVCRLPIPDGGGARIQEGVAALTQFAEIFRRNVAASG